MAEEGRQGEGEVVGQGSLLSNYTWEGKNVSTLQNTHTHTHSHTHTRGHEILMFNFHKKLHINIERINFIIICSFINRIEFGAINLGGGEDDSNEINGCSAVN